MWKRKPRPKPVPFTPNEEQIRAKAYELWQQRGPDSTPEENWQDAIHTLRCKERRRRLTKPIWRLCWKTGLTPLVQSFFKWTGVPEKKEWDVVQLLVAPIVLTVIGLGLQEYLKQKDQFNADDKAKQDTLVKYLDQMAESLKDGLLRAKPGDEKFIIAQARTVTALQSLDRKRQHLIIQFLRASGLSQTSEDITPQRSGHKDGVSKARTETNRKSLGGKQQWPSIPKSENITNEDITPKKLAPQDRALLYRAQMEKANLTNSDLSGSVVIEANLQEANFGCNPQKSENPNQCSDLSGANFRGSDLTDANLTRANLKGINLGNANLTRVNLSNANLGNLCKGLQPCPASLYHANLSGAILLNIKLNDVGYLNERQLKYQQKLASREEPLLCNVLLPKEMQIDPNRDCDRLPKVLHDRYPDQFTTIEEAQAYVNEARKKKWD